MPKSVSTDLLDHLRGPATTTCGLLKIGPIPVIDGDDLYVCMTSLDRDVEFEGMTFRAATGFDSSATVATSDLGVDNAEASTLQPVFPVPGGITREMVDRGDLDNVRFEVHWVDYEDVAAGSVLWSAGQLGEVQLTPGGLVKLELRSWSQLLRQKSVVQLYSRRCRADFGSGPIGSGWLKEERFPCNYDLDENEEWVQAEVIAVGDETVREFTIKALDEDVPLAATDAYYAPGLFVFTAGDNAGQSPEIEANTPGTSMGVPFQAITLLMTTRNPIKVGDRGRIRRGCSKTWSGHNSCTTYANKQWFRGEKDIPVGDSVSLNVPRGTGFIGRVTEGVDGE